jgi:hypothetical protein
MKLSKDKLTEYINLYLNDVCDYGDDGEYEVVESVLKPITSTLEEGEHDLHNMLKETAKNSSQHKNIILEFISYVNEIQ